jgi:hypothetical protein
MSIQFFLTVWKIPESVHPASLLFYWCLWLLLPITLFGTSALLGKDGGDSDAPVATQITENAVAVRRELSTNVISR